VEAIRARGYAIDDEEDEIGYRCLGMPIFDEAHTAVAAISLAGSLAEVNNENMKALVAELKQAADAITAALNEEQAQARSTES
jgi:DNA-binding IclR family transcriptional regulator